MPVRVMPRWEAQGVADSIVQGRQPWLQEPTCEQCYGVNHSTGQDLYRHSKGHVGINGSQNAGLSDVHFKGEPDSGMGCS